jgi:AraC-like DNA-binding protein
MLTNLTNKQVSALALPQAVAYTLTRRGDASATAFPWQADTGRNMAGAGTAGERQAGTVEGWLKALEQSFGTCVRMIPAGSESVLSGNGRVCRALDDLHGPRALCRQVHRAVHAAAAGTGCPQRVRCPLGFLLLSMPVQTRREFFGQIEFGPLMVEPADRAEFERSLGRLGVPPGLWPPLQSALGALSVIRDESTRGVLALLQRVASAIADEMPRAASGDAAQMPIAVAEARRFAEQHLGDKIALADVARHVTLSADHFSRLFRCTLGMPFGEYVNRCRVARAQQLLAGSARRVAEVSFACGFDSVPHFNRVFRRIAGTSPTRFRRQVGSL